MQTVQSFMSRNPPASAAAQPSASSSQLNGLSQAGSAVSALAKFGMSLQQASSLEQQAQQERFQGQQEYVNAQETANAIDQKYQSVIGAQHAAAVGAGVDLSSASITEARYRARQNADAAIQGARTTADMNIALRRARAAALKQQAGATRILGFANLAADVATAAATGA